MFGPFSDHGSVGTPIGGGGLGKRTEHPTVRTGSAGGFGMTSSGVADDRGGREHDQRQVRLRQWCSKECSNAQVMCNDQDCEDKF